MLSRKTQKIIQVINQLPKRKEDCDIPVLFEISVIPHVSLTHDKSTFQHKKAIVKKQSACLVKGEKH